MSNKNKMQIPILGMVFLTVTLIAGLIAFSVIKQFVDLFNQMGEAEDPLTLLANIGTFSTIGAVQLLFALLAVIVLVIFIPLTITFIILKR